MEKGGLYMRLKNVLITVQDTKRAKTFYKDLFGLDVILDGDANVMLTEGLVLQDRKVWEDSLGEKAASYSSASELYFEETDLEGFAGKLQAYEEVIRYTDRLRELPGGQKMLRFYDPDGNLIEVRTPAGISAEKET